MKLGTHLSVGVLTSMLIAPSITIVEAVLIAAGTLVPDIDHKGSAIGKGVPFISTMLEHRGFTHSLIFAFLMAVINPYFGLGVLLHIFLDMMTNKGVKLFYPNDRSIRFPLAKHVVTGGKFEELLLSVIMLVISILFARTVFLYSHTIVCYFV